jgi:uncharacterized protein with HEPN domain
MVAANSPRVRLLHMRDEIKSLSSELLGLDLEIYRESYALRRITERAIQIISEAARAIPEELRFRIRAKLTDREGGGQFLYSYFGWHAEIVS